MYHSITFGSKNTWDDWHLIPETDPIIAPPEQKKNLIDIPGANGSLDMSEVLTGYPTYNNRTGSLSFYVMNPYAATMPECNPIKLRNLISNIMNYFSGKKDMQMILEDDRAYFYRGRFKLESVNTGESFTTISIGYDVEPYKWSIYGTVDNWIWDTFNFQIGKISSEYANLPVTTTQNSITLQDSMIGNAPVAPEFRITTNAGQTMFIRFINPTLGIDEERQFPPGTHVVNDFVMYGDLVTIMYRMATGTGTLTINYRQGGL